MFKASKKQQNVHFFCQQTHFTRHVLAWMLARFDSSAGRSHQVSPLCLCSSNIINICTTQNVVIKSKFYKYFICFSLRTKARRVGVETETSAGEQNRTRPLFLLLQKQRASKRRTRNSASAHTQLNAPVVWVWRRTVRPVWRPARGKWRGCGSSALYWWRM